MAQRKFILTVFLVFLSGCATESPLSVWLFGHSDAYYTDPNSPGYSEARFGILCEQCGRESVVSAKDLASAETVTCLFDGHVQNLQQARNRYLYASEQQRKAIAAQMVMQGFSAYNQSLEQSAQRQHEILLNAQNNLPTLGGFNRNTTQTHTTGTIRPNSLLGGYDYEETTR